MHLENKTLKRQHLIIDTCNPPINVKVLFKGFSLDYYTKETGLSPQEYWFKNLRKDGEDFRTMFAEWAAHNAADMDYLTREQFKQSKNHYKHLKN